MIKDDRQLICGWPYLDQISQICSSKRFHQLTDKNLSSSISFIVLSQGESVGLLDLMEFIHDVNNLNQMSLLWVTLVLLSSVIITVHKDDLRTLPTINIFIKLEIWMIDKLYLLKTSW